MFSSIFWTTLTIVAFLIGLAIIVILSWEIVKFFLSFRKPIEDNKLIMVEKKEDLKPFHRMNDLFQGMPTYGGHEWENLSVEHLVSVFTEAIGISHRVGGETEQSLLLAAANKCQSLSFHVTEEVKNPLYQDVDMSHFIEKPLVVATRLREIAFDMT